MVRSQVLLVWVVCCGLAAPAAAQTLTSQTADVIIRPWRDYATHQLRDSWDMASKSDIGFFTWGVDQPASNMTGKKITTDLWGNTVFQGTPANADPSFFLLDPLFTAGAPLGKIGANFPITTSQFTHLYVKMRVANEVKPSAFGAAGGLPVMQVFWSRDSIFSSHSDPVNGRVNGGLLTSVNGAGNQVGFPLSPTPSGCQGESRPCGAMEGGRYVIHAIPLADPAALAALSSEFARWKNINDPTGASDIDWAGTGTLTADSLRFDPVQISAAAVGTIDVDWVRLVAPGADPPQTISWSGGGTYDVVVSQAADCGAGTLPGVPAGNYAVVAYNQSTGYTFHPQILPGGAYYVGLRDPLTANGLDSPSTRQIRACSTGRFLVRDYPELALTAPDPLGSADDFATVQLNNPWDMDGAGDLDVNLNITAPTFRTIEAERPDGRYLGAPIRVFFGVSAPGTAATDNVGDPHSYLIRSDRRGLHTRIDTTRYRLLTIDAGVNHERDVLTGSVMRVVWHIAGETWDTIATPSQPSVVADAENVSNDFLLHHFRKDPARNEDAYSTRYTVERIQADLADRLRLPLEQDPGRGTSPSRTGWANGALQCAATGCATWRVQPFDRIGVDNFRVDFVEYPQPTEFYLHQVRLAAHERTTGQFAIRWTHTMPAFSPGTETAADWKVALYAVPTRPASGSTPASPMTPVTTNCAAGAPSAIPITTASGTTAHPALSAGLFTWATAGTAGLTDGALYFICAGLIEPGQSSPVVFNFSVWPVIYQPGASSELAPRLFVDRTTVWMAARHTGADAPPNLSFKTPAETVTVTQVGGTTAVGWAVDVCQSYDPASPPTCTGTLDYIQLSRTTGAGTGSFTVQIKDSSVLPQNTGSSPIGVVLRVRETSGGATANSPQFVQVYLTITPSAAPASPPTGQVDTPVQNASGVQGAIGVTGWVVDDVGIRDIRIYRNCLGFDDPNSCALRLGVNTVEIGTAARVPGARPDVESAFSTRPQAHVAGWGYLMLTNMLPHLPNALGYGGQGPLQLYVIATDIEGNEVLLGRTQSDQTPTAITLDNDAIAKPFGAIDTPSQGGMTSGALANFGWALTPDANNAGGEPGDVVIPTNGSTMFVFVDGVAVGNVTYNQCRGTVGNPPAGGVHCDDDVANIFGNPTPQAPLSPRSSNPTRFRNLDAGRAAIGSFDIDTRTLSNGLHSIAWSVRDSAGRIEGIGSRNFLVVNGVSDAAMGHDVGRPLADLHALTSLPAMVPTRLGWDLDAAFAPASLSEGRARVTAREFERVELQLPRTLSGEAWDGYVVQQERLTPLPIGATLDRTRGRFSWQTVPGVLGEHQLLFVRTLTTGQRETLPVTVMFVPGTSSATGVARR